jgi:hypothetical protein
MSGEGIARGQREANAHDIFAIFRTTECLSSFRCFCLNRCGHDIDNGVDLCVR